MDCCEQLQPESFLLSTPTRKTKPNAFSDLLIVPRFFEFMQKFEVEQDIGDQDVLCNHFLSVFLSMTPE
jgi:hypothetical protein